MYNLAIRECTSPPLLAQRLNIFKWKFTTPPRIKPRTCWIRGRHACYHLSQRGELQPWKSQFSNMFLHWSSTLFPLIWIMVGWRQFLRLHVKEFTRTTDILSISKTNSYENNLFKSTIKEGTQFKAKTISCNYHNIFNFLIQVI